MSNVANKVVVRYPPSPTGLPHIGNIRTFLFNFLYARQQGGEIVMRFEDTDRARSKREHEEGILHALDALGLTFDAGPFRQSERGERYAEVIAQLIAQGDAYEGELSEDGSGEQVVRFKNPNTVVSFVDAVRGEITIDTTDFGDFIIARSKTNPLYHLTVVVDDIDMGITHVIRGADHITSTPRQILLIRALGGTVPEYAHLPMIIGDDGKKLGKRHGAVSYQDFEKLGYLPHAVVNYLALVGWNPGKGSEQEYFTMAELIEQFSLEGLQQSPAKFSYEKLDSVNRHYIVQLNDEEFAAMVQEWLPAEQYRGERLYPLLRERISTFGEVPAVCEEDFGWITGAGNYAPGLLIWKKGTRKDAHKHLSMVAELLHDVGEWNAESVKAAVWSYAETEGRGDVLWPLRTALTGRERSPDPFAVADILGREETLMRLNAALSQLMV